MGPSTRAVSLLFFTFCVPFLVMPRHPRTSRTGYSKARLTEVADALHTAARTLYVTVSFISLTLTTFSTPFVTRIGRCYTE